MFWFLGTNVRIELKKADDAFLLMKELTDTEAYQFKLTDCILHVPVAQLALPVFNQLSSLLAEKPVVLHYRKTEIREVSLPKHKREYFSENLFSSDIPCRVVVCLIENDRKEGNYTNPYDFRRSWKVTSTSLDASETSSREHALEQRLDKLQKTFDLILQSQTTSTSKGGPRKSSEGFLTRLRSPFVGNQEEEEVKAIQNSNDPITLVSTGYLPNKLNLLSINLFIMFSIAFLRNNNQRQVQVPLQIKRALHLTMMKLLMVLLQGKYLFKKLNCY